MANERLKTLTDKIYQEGVQKAKNRGDKIISDSQAEADEILKSAEKQAEDIIKSAQDTSQKIHNQVKKEMELALEQTLIIGKRRLADLITAKTIHDQIKGTFSDSDFIKRLLEIMVEKALSATHDASTTHLQIPQEWEKDLEQFFQKHLQEALDAGMQLSLDPSIQEEIVLKRVDQGYQLRFSDELFENFFMRFLRPKTRQILFKE